MNRRTLLLAPLLLAACQTTPPTPSQIATDLTNLGAALTNDLVLLQPVLGIPDGTMRTYRTVIADVVSVAAQVSGLTLDPGIGVTAVFSDVQALLRASAPIVALLPPVWTEALAAANILLPTLAALAGVALPAATAPVLGVATSVPEARKTLAAHAKR